MLHTARNITPLSTWLRRGAQIFPFSSATFFGGDLMRAVVLADGAALIGRPVRAALLRTARRAFFCRTARRGHARAEAEKHNHYM